MTSFFSGFAEPLRKAAISNKQSNSEAKLAELTASAFQARLESARRTALLYDIECLQQSLIHRTNSAYALAAQTQIPALYMLSFQQSFPMH
jgi:hypothetical protein